MDKKFLRWMLNLRTKKLNKFMVFITHLGTGGFLWILSAIIFYFVSYKALAYNIILSLFLNGILCNFILKPLLRRKRPSWIKKVDLLIKNPHDFSFPSGHAASSFAAATTIFFYIRNLSIIFLVLAFLISFSRIYHFVHYPSDVIVGIFIGITIAFISEYLFKSYVFDFLNARDLLNFIH
ncbi:phosphatase PAP2 family protein [uncultured Peptoniphilus sp.]|uniref:phosphatase PAP2 family protein n=1 Tax=uncultured Peptoniphilus sp. TaxID=254354 RepID=UPI002804B877|nr:phosphatase PAP2 family protein [uncultured Peptoniphilus sp.]